jgi:glycosyltransferase involved in cell wall biosynthesis
MKIAFLTTDNREQRNQYEVERPFFGPAPQAVIDGLARHGSDVEVHVISCARRRMAAPAKLAPNIWFHQPIVPLAGWGRTAFLGCGWAVARVLRSLAPDLVHAQGTERDCAVSMLLAPCRPKLLTIHGCMSEMQRQGLHGNRRYGRLVSSIEKIALRRADGVFCNSDYTEGLVGRLSRRTWRVPNAVRTPFLDRPNRSRERSNETTLINVGLLSSYKRQLEILRVIRGLRSEGHRVRIWFVGPADWESEYGRGFGEELREAGESGAAEHLGYRDESALIDLLDQADGAVHFPTMETFGLVVAEALARGLKFFGSDRGGVPDVARGVPGAEIHASEEGLAAGIRSWLEAGAPRHPEAADAIRARFSEQAVAERHVEIYKACLGISKQA